MESEAASTESIESSTEDAAVVPPLVPPLVPPEPAVAVAPVSSTRVQSLPVALALLAVLALSIAVVMAQQGRGGAGSTTPARTALSSVQPTAAIVAVVTVSSPSPVSTSQEAAGTPPPTAIPTSTDIVAVTLSNTSLPPSPTSPPATVPTATPKLAVPTATRIVPPTASPQPTNTPQLVIGSTANAVNGWTIKPSGVDTREELRIGASNVIYRPNGIFWLVRIDIRNDAYQPRSLVQTTDFVLSDGLGTLYPELSNHGTQADMREVAAQQGFSYLSNVLPRGGSAATLLIFDLPRGAQPKQLVARTLVGGNSVSPTGQVTWSLSNR